MAINLRKPPVGTIGKVPKQIVTRITLTDGIVFRNLLIEITRDKSARKTFRDMIAYHREYYGEFALVDFVEEAIRETVLIWFEGEIDFCPHQDILLSFVTDSLHSAYCEETARALIYLLDSYCEEPEPDTDGHYIGKVSE